MMVDHQIFLNVLLAGAGSIGQLLLMIFLALIFLLLCGLWMPLSLKCVRSTDGPGANQLSTVGGMDWSWILSATLATGIATSITCWTLSYYVSSTSLIGTVLLILICLASLVVLLVWKPSICFAMLRPYLLLGVSLFAVAMSLWHHAATELPMLNETEAFLYSDMQGDLYFHTFLAGLIQDAGLPLQNLQASSHDQYSAVTHTGHAVLLAGVSDVLHISLYQSSTVLWVLVTLLIAWSALALVIDANPGRLFAFFLVVGVLVWGAFGMPDPNWLVDPGTAVSESDNTTWIAARGFWNFPQELSISLTLASLLLLECYGSFRKAGRAPLSLLAVAIWIIVVGGWAKPSLFIFYGPALFIWFAINKARPAEYVCTMAIFSAGALIYLLPMFFSPLPAGSAWGVSNNGEQWLWVGKFLIATPSILLLSLYPLSQQKHQQQWRVFDLAFIAFGGSVLFAALFYQPVFADRILGFQLYQPNLWWGFTACIILLIPLLGKAFLFQRNPGIPWRVINVVAISIALVQITNGLSVALTTPVLNLRAHEKAKIEVLNIARSLVPPGTPIARDPIFSNDLLSYLPRPTVFVTSSSSPASQAAFNLWMQFCVENVGSAEMALEIFDAVIIHRQRAHVSEFLAADGWNLTRIGQDIQLWSRPETK